MVSTLTSASDRIPTKWFAGIGTVAFLLATAGIGGFADVPETPIATVELGEALTTQQVELEVQDLVVLDDIPDLYLTVPEGERVVGVLAHATNVWTAPQSTMADLDDLLRLEVDGISDAPPMMIARVDDALTNPRLQPGLRVPLVFVWTVPAAAVADGDEITVAVFDRTRETGQAVIDGQYWGEPVLAATVTAPVHDLGTGEADR